MAILIFGILIGIVGVLFLLGCIFGVSAASLAFAKLGN